MIFGGRSVEHEISIITALEIIDAMDVVRFDPIPVYIDVDLAANGELSSRYGISAIPSIVVVDADGKVLKRGSFMSASSMVGFLSTDAT